MPDSQGRHHLRYRVSLTNYQEAISMTHKGPASALGSPISYSGLRARSVLIFRCSYQFGKYPRSCPKSAIILKESYLSPYRNRRSHAICKQSSLFPCPAKPVEVNQHCGQAVDRSSRSDSICLTCCKISCLPTKLDLGLSLIIHPLGRR